MHTVKILDCTLRDGGCVIDFDFGTEYMSEIVAGLEDADIDIIELGYIDHSAGVELAKTKFISDRAIYSNFTLKKECGRQYVAMIDYGRYDPAFLLPRGMDTIDGIRLAFHKKDRDKMICWGRTIIEKGYDLYLQPMTCLRYTDAEILSLIEQVNNELKQTKAFYIVDSFGEMRRKDVERITCLVNHNLNRNIALGFHSHNNLQLSYSHAVDILGRISDRDLIFDASILGMGKGAGNMNTELFAENLNLNHGKQYKLYPLFEVIDKVLNQIREENSWGYAIEYYLSAMNSCTPSYAKYFYAKHILTISQIAEILKLIPEEKKVSFDKNFADEIYFQFYSQERAHKNSDKFLRDFEQMIHSKRILLIAPGKSIKDHNEEISRLSQSVDTMVIAINHVPIIVSDFIFVTKYNIMEMIKGDHVAIPLIISSNISNDSMSAGVVDYKKFSIWEGKYTDISAIILINFLNSFGIDKIMLAGFDGFTLDIDSNYFDEKLKRPINKPDCFARNENLKRYFKQLCEEGVQIEFLTPSIYDCD